MSSGPKSTQAPRYVFIDLSASGVVKIIDEAVFGPEDVGFVLKGNPAFLISLMNKLPNSSSLTLPMKLTLA